MGISKYGKKGAYFTARCRWISFPTRWRSSIFSLSSGYVKFVSSSTQDFFNFLLVGAFCDKTSICAGAATTASKATVGSRTRATTARFSSIGKRNKSIVLTYVGQWVSYCVQNFVLFTFLNFLASRGR